MRSVVKGSRFPRSLSAGLHRRALERRLAAVGRELSAGGLVRARSGNLSTRDRDGFRITAAGSRLAHLGHDDFAWVAANGEARGGGPRPSSEVALHAAIYLARSDVGAILHTHSPYATAWASIAVRLELGLEEAAYYGMGSVVRVAPYAPAGGTRLAHLARTHLGDGAAVLLERHGAVAVGPDLQAALDVAESLEHQAHVAWVLSRGDAGGLPAVPPSRGLLATRESGWRLG